MSKIFTMRVPVDTEERLKRHAAGINTPPRTLAQRYLEEGLRMDEHPMIFFADGPAGRRARLLGTGADIWEVIAAVKDNGVDEEAAARYLDMPVSLVRGAVTYYAAFPEEIDSRIERNRIESEQAEAAWLAGRELLRS